MLLRYTISVTGTPPIPAVRPGSKLVPETTMSAPPELGPAEGVTANAIRCENSEVLPSTAVDVAVAEIRDPAGMETGSMTSKCSAPDTTVSGTVPIQVSPSRNSRGCAAQGGFA